STWVGRTRTPEATEAERIEAGARLRGLTSTTTALILAIGGLRAVILLSAAGPLQTFFTAIDAANDVADVPFDSMGRATMVMALHQPGRPFCRRGYRLLHPLDRFRHP